VKLAFTLLIALFTFAVMIGFARLYFRNEIARSERYLQISKAMIISLDCGGNVKLINTRGCEILGYSEKELLGKNWFETVVPGSVRDGVYKSFRKIITGEIEPLRQYENEIVTKSGDHRTIEWNNDLERNLKGEIVGTLSSGQDITDRKLAEADIHRQQRDLAHVMRLSTVGEMATGLAHELNQPLTALVSYCGTASSIVKTMTAPPPQLDDIMRRAMDQAHRAGDIIRHLRGFAGNKEGTKELFFLDQVIKDTVLFLKGEVQHCDASIELYLDCQICSVFADKVQIEQVLVNLIRNSLESFEQADISDGHIDIRSSLLPNNMAEVIITDTGPGIDASITNKIFDQFQTTKETGMGVGLSLSRKIIESHGGKLWCDYSYQRGASFGFMLPLGG
jgi:PAS domain S-box-containing protein